MCSVHQKKDVSTLTCVTLCAGRYSPLSGLPGGLPQHGGRAWPPWGCGQAVKGRDEDLDQHFLNNNKPPIWEWIVFIPPIKVVIWGMVYYCVKHIPRHDPIWHIFGTPRTIHLCVRSTCRDLYQHWTYLISRLARTKIAVVHRKMMVLSGGYLVDIWHQKKNREVTTSAIQSKRSQGWARQRCWSAALAT